MEKKLLRTIKEPFKGQKERIRITKESECKKMILTLKTNNWNKQSKSEQN